MPIRAQLFDGTILEFPDGTSPDVINSTAKRMTDEVRSAKQPEEMPEKRGVLESVIPAIKRGFGQFGEIGAGYSLAGSKLIGDESSVAKKMAEAKADIQAQKDRGLSVADIQRIYKEKGLVDAAGEVPQFLVEQTLQSLPTMATPLAAGAATTALTAPILGPLAPVAGTLAGIGAYGLQTFGSGVQRQAVEKQKPEEIELGKAAVASAIGAPLGYLMDRVTALGGAKGVKEVAKELAARKAAGEIGAAGVAAGVAKQAVKGTGVGFIAEAPTEFLEAVLDRWQAGLSLTGEEAKQEYLEAGIAGGGVGGTIGGASRGARTYGGYRGEGKPQQSEFDRRRAEIEGKSQAPTPLDEASPLENPYGNIPAADIGDVAAQINEARAKRKQSPLQSFSVEDIVESGLPPEQTDQLLSAALTKSGFDPAQAVEPQDIMDAAAERGLDIEQPGFRDFLRRASGAENPEQMTPVQRVAAFGAIQSLPEGIDSLPTGTNAQRFTEPQYKAGLKAIKGAISGGASRDNVIAAIQKTGVKDIRDAQSILQNAIKGGEVGAVSTPTFTVMDDFGKPVRSYDSREQAEQLAGRLNGQVQESSVTKFVSPEMAGGDIRPGSYRDEPAGFEIRAGDTVLRKADTAEDAEAAAERLQQIRGRLASTFNNQVEGINQKIASSNQPLEVMEAQGQADTPQYAKLKKQTDKTVQELTKKRDALVQQAAEFSRPLHVGAAAPKAVGKKGFTRFEGGRPVEYLSSLGALPKPTTGPVTDRDVANIDALRKKLLPALKRFGLEGVGLRVVKSIEDGGAGADGAYADKLIQVALSAENPMGVMRHEVIHALKELGAFTAKEWRVLEGKAKSEWVNKFIREAGTYERYQQVYENATGSLEGFDEYINEEAIAEAFKYFDATKVPPGLVGNLFGRIRNFFASLRNALQGAGFQTAEEVLGRIEEGKVTPTRAEAPAAPKFSVPTRPEIKQALTRNITGEVIPSTKTEMAQVSEVPMVVKQNLTDEILNSGIVQQMAGLLGVRSEVKVTPGTGGYEGSITPNLIVQVFDPNPEVSANDAAKISAAMTYVFKQDAVPYFRADPRLIDSDQRGYRITFGSEQLTDAQERGLFNALRSIMGDGAGYTKMSGNQMVLINYRGEDGKPFLMDDEAFASAVSQFKDTASDIVSVNNVEQFGAESEYPYHDWKDDAAGVGIIAGLQGRTGGRPDIQNGLDSLRKSFVDSARESVRSAGLEPRFSLSDKRGRLGDPRYGKRVTTDTIEVDGQDRPTRTSKGTLIYPTEEGVRNFWRWFGNSVFVDEDGRPLVMYHGTAADIEEFIPKQANAIFITPQVEFSAEFKGGVLTGVATWAENWMVEHYDEILSPEQIEAAKLEALENIDPETKRDYRLSKNAHHSAFVETSEFMQAIKDQLPSRANVIPLFVKSENPFNYSNKNHVRQVVDRLFLDFGVDLEQDPNGRIRFMNEADSMADREYSENEVYNMLTKGYWPLIEQAEVQDVIRDLGFDGFSVQESLVKNYAVFDPNQVKSSVGNDGNFSDKKSIRFSIAQSKTPEFKQWFRESKVSDKSGKPILMYHSTPSPDDDIFSVFKRSDDGKLGQGIYTTSVERYAEGFAPTGAVMPLWVSIQNPLYLDLSSPIEKGRSPRDVLRAKMAGKEDSGKVDYLRLDGSGAKEISDRLNAEIKAISGRRLMDMSGATIRRTLQKAGYDGIIVRDTDGNFVEVNAFEPTQIKSATGNRGTFSRSNKDIRYSLAQTKTPEFKRWFGDSKVVDEKGNPLVVYHGTTNDIESFATRQKVPRGRFYAGELGSWFGSDVGIANRFSTGRYSENGVVYPVYLSIRNPKEFYSYGELLDFAGNRKSAAAVRRDLEAEGFDGIVIRNSMTDLSPVRDDWVAFKPTQIKSAVGNRGTFDPTKKDIRYSFEKDIKGKAGLGQAAVDEIKRTTAKREEEGFIQRLISAISPDNAEKFRALYINKYQALERNTKAVADRFGESRLLADQSAIAAALMSSRAAGVAGQSYMNGIPVYEKGYTRVDDLGGKVKGLIPILEPLMKYNDPFVFQAFQFYGATRRGARLFREGREKLLTPQDIRFGKLLEKEYPEFKQVFDEYQKYNRGLVKFLVDTGVLTEEMGRKWTMYADYIPFYRQADGEETFGPKLFHNLSGVQPTKKLKGGEFKLDDFLETVVRNTKSAVEQGMKNIAAQRAVNEAMMLNTPGQFDYAKKLPAGADGGPDIVNVREKGVDVKYKVADPMWVEAMKGLYAQNPYEDLLKIVGFPTRMLRNIVTKMPDFMVANLLRDSMSAWVTSGSDFKPIIDTFKQAGKELSGGSPEARLLRAAGVATGYEFAGDVKASAKEFSKELRAIAGKRTTAEKVMLPLDAAWNLLEKGSNLSDIATRAEVARRTLAETGNEAEAVFRAIEVMNFDRMGASLLVQVMAAITPFFNARVQGLDLLYRAGMGELAQTNRKAAHKAFIVRATTLIALSAVYWMLASDTDDYKKANEETRDNNWIIGPVKLPIPYEIGVLFKVIPERIMGYFFGTDTGKDVKDAAVRQVTSTLGINPVPQAILPILENVVDYSFFTARPVIPKGMEDVAPQFQKTSTTSLVAQKLGEATGKSPIQIDNLINGYFGALGSYTALAIDSMLRTTSDPVKPSMRLDQMPIIRRFLTATEAQGTVGAFYDLKDAVDEATRTSNFLQNSGSYDQYAAYMKENGKLFQVKPLVQHIDKDMTALRDYERQIMALREKDISAEDKQVLLETIRQSRNNLTDKIRELRKQISRDS